jgi:beta-galactosidase
MTDLGALSFSQESCEGACFYRASFDLTAVGDTSLDTSEFGKGQLWLNGVALGRIWDVGPQKTLYTPGPWLKVGKNEVVVFDLRGKMGATVRGLDHPVLDGVIAKMSQ